MFKRDLYFYSSVISRLMEREWGLILRRVDLTPPVALALRVVLHSPGITPSKLARALFIERSSGTRVIDILHKKKLVFRRDSRDDAREYHIFPTKLALELVAELESADEITTELIVDKLGETLVESVVLDMEKVVIAFGGR